MSLTITTTLQDAAYSDVPAAEVVEKTRAMGHADAARAIAITAPRIRSDTKSLSFEQRAAAGGAREFRFQQGTFPLTLVQEVFFSAALNACEKRIWRVHEDLHVQDNRGVMGRMEAALRADPAFKEILIDRKWYPRSQFDQVNRTINDRVGAIFRAFTEAEARNRDTGPEYQRVWRETAACRPAATP